MTPYKDEASKFLTTLYGDFESDQFLYLWTLPDRRTWSFPVSDLGTMITAVEPLSDTRDVYFGIGTATKKIPRNRRPKAKEVFCLPGLWVEIDIAVIGAHAKKNLPSSIEEALSVLPDFLEPTLVIWSGNGFHVYWLFKKPWKLNSQEENGRAALLSIRLQAFIKQLADEHGWHIDSTADLNRVLRVPGTLNHKQGQKKPVFIHTTSEIRYEPEELEEILPEIDLKAHLKEQHSFERRDSDAPADLMIANCLFLQHCSLDASDISYGEWLTMLTNVVRSKDGIEKCHELSSLDPERYCPEDADFKIAEALKLNPHTCEYIRTAHSFKCPEHGCGVKAPCSFSLSKIDQARAKVSMLENPNAENIYTEDMLKSLAVVKVRDTALFARTKDKLRGVVNLRDFENAVKQFIQKAISSDFAALPESKEIDPPISGIKYPANFRFTDNGIIYVQMTNNGPQFIRACGCPTVMDGLMTRTIELDGGPLAENQELARELYAILPTCHGHAGVAFLQGLMIAERSEVVSFYREAQKWLKQNFTDRIDSHLDTVATVMTADYFANMWVFSQEANTARTESYAMAETIAGKLIRKEEASESERAWLEFQDWVGERHEQLSSVYPNTKIGIREGGYIYVIRRVVNEFLAKYSSAQKIIQAWAESEKIKTWEDSGKKRFDIQKRLGGVKARCIAFPAEMDDFDDDFLGVGTGWGQSGDTL